MTTEKIGVKSITLTRAEGPIGECDKPKAVASWLEANHVLYKWSRTAPKTGGYDKCDFKVVFEDGETYDGRYDLVHYTVEYPNLKRHVASFVNYLAGIPPLWMTRDNKKDVLARYRRQIEQEAERTAGAKQFQERYDVVV